MNIDSQPARIVQVRFHMPNPPRMKFSWRIDRKSGVPFHRQIEEQLLRLSRSSKFAQGQLFPDELTLANQFGVSRGTVRSGLLSLVQQGILERRAGIGTRVVRRPVESGLIAWRSFSREMQRHGIEVQLLFSQVTQAKAQKSVANALKIAEGTIVLCLDRVRGWDHKPVQHSRAWFHPRLSLTGKEDFSQPLYEFLLAHSGVDADHAHEEFKAVKADAEMSKRLRISKGAPLLLRRQTTYDNGERPIDYTEIHYRTDHFTLTLDLRRDS